MTVRLTLEDMNKLTAQELDELNVWRKEQGLPKISWLGDLDPFVVALEAQRKLFKELKLHSFESRKGALRIQCIPHVIWDSIKEELEI